MTEPGGLAADLLAPNDLRKGGVCSVATLFARLDTEDPDAAQALRTVLADVEMPCTIVARRLEAHGIRIAADRLQRHRRGDCKCPT